MAGHFSEWVAGLGPGIANHLWQSTAFAAGAWLLTLALRSNQARVRHAVWLAASVKFLIPFSLLIAAGNLLPHPRQAVAPVVYSAMDVVEEPFAIAPQFVAPPVHVPTLRERLDAALPLSLAAIWFLGAGVVLVVWTVRWRAVKRILRDAEVVHDGRELDILRSLEAYAGTRSWVAHSSRALCAMSGERNAQRRTTSFVPLRLSSARMEPGIFGVFRPVLVWPRQLSARLDDEHIEAIVAHELAHVRRRDNLTAALHMLVETVFWFHPLVWWMERRMVAEREQACDEAVVEVMRSWLDPTHRYAMNGARICSAPISPRQSLGGAPEDEWCVQSYAETYAEALLKTCRFCIESPLVCVAGVTGADLKQRVVGIVTGRALLRMSWPKKLLLAAAAVCVIAAPVVLGQAKAAQRLMLAAIEAAPKPVQMAAKAMMADATPSSEDIAQAQPPAMPPGNAGPTADDMSLGPAFEVATIRSGNPNDGRRTFGVMVDASGRFTGSATALGFLVPFAYSSQLTQVRVNGGPAWVKSDMFDITAKVDAAYMTGWDKLSYAERMNRVKPMLRTLLAQRFRLKLHVEMQPTPVYVLVQAKGGAKVKEVPAPAAVDNGPEASMRWYAEHPGEPKPGSIHCSDGCTATAVQMSNAVTQIGANARADRIVIDGTGLKGYYDFKFTMPRANDDQAMEEVEDDLGVKFEARTVPMKTYVIDSAEKPSVDGAEVAPAAGVAPPAAAQPATTAAELGKLKFDVVSIRRNISGSREMTRQSAADTDNITMTNVPLALVLFYAYWMNDPNMTTGVPDWAWSERYDVVAKVAPSELAAYHALTKQQRAAMLQPVLADRFKLQAHHENKDRAVYALVVAKGGPKLKDAQPGEAHPNTDKANPAAFQKGATIFATGANQITGEAAGMGELAVSLSTRGFEALGLGRPVIDKTGLTGRYDFVLQFPLPDANAPSADRDDAPQESAASLSNALQDQLGLKLQPATAPSDYLVIDHIEHPSAN